MLCPVIIAATKKAPELVVDKDEHLRLQTTLEHLAKLRSVKEGGVTTAGNSSGLNDIDVYERNEAFAAQNLCVIREIEEQMGGHLDMSRWNPHGGAIAFGHPNAASGTRIFGFAMKHLQDTKGRYSLVSSCCGGGQGTSTLIEPI